MKIRLTKKEGCISALTFLLGYLLLIAVMFLIIWVITLDEEVTCADFIILQYKGIIAAIVSAVVLSAIMYAFFFFENKSVLAHYGKIIEIFVLLSLSLLICMAISHYVSPIASPLLFLPMMAVMLLPERRDAIFVNSIYALMLFTFSRFLMSSDLENVLIGSMTTMENFSRLFIAFCVGILAIFLLKGIKTRLGCVWSAVILYVPVTVINIVMQLPYSDNPSWGEVADIFLSAALDCTLSVLLFMFLLPVFETIFSELTPFRLRELTSDSAKIIRKLKTNAPGTYNHSVVVAQLAEACASAIGEDAELARAAAYYHDVGKLKNPEMFTENQGEYDLHRELTPELSVDIIRAHARDGAKLIKKNHLPDFFADVAVEHHGTMPIKYFYAKALKMSDGELNVGNYSYSGPTPTTKISAIIMLADASEAATRSLSDKSPEKVEKLVHSIVEERMNLDQFSECDITLHELTVISRTIVTSLTGVYHLRVQYPKLILSQRNRG